MRRALVLLAVALRRARRSSPAPSAQDGDEKVVFTVGIANDVDTLNPLVGVEVPDYEVWNIQYATLTDKAAADFHTIPGLAESWTSSNGGKTYTYKLRDGPEVVGRAAADRRGRRVHGQPGARGGVAQLLVDRRQPEGEARSIRRPCAITSSVPDPKLPTMDVLHPPEAHLGQVRRRRQITKYNGLDGVGSGPFTLIELKRGQFWTLQANPNYWGGKPAVDEVVFRLFNNRDAMVAALKQGEIDAAHDVPSSAFQDLEATDGIVTRRRASRAASTSSPSTAGDGHRRSRHPALLDLRVPPGDRARDRQADDRRPRARRPRRRPGRR